MNREAVPQRAVFWIDKVEADVVVFDINDGEGPFVVADQFCATFEVGFPFEKLTYPLFGAAISYWYVPAITWVYGCPSMATWFAGWVPRGTTLMGI